VFFFSSVFSGFLRTILQVLDFVIHRSRFPIALDDEDYESESSDEDFSSNLSSDDDYETSDEGDDEGIDDMDEDNEDEDEEMPEEPGPVFPPGGQNPPPPPPPPPPAGGAGGIPDAQLCQDVNMMLKASSW
jgi:hypothetical protein